MAESRSQGLSLGTGVRDFDSRCGFFLAGAGWARLEVVSLDPVGRGQGRWSCCGPWGAGTSSGGSVVVRTKPPVLQILLALVCSCRQGVVLAVLSRCVPDGVRGVSLMQMDRNGAGLGERLYLTRK